MLFDLLTSGLIVFTYLLLNVLVLVAAAVIRQCRQFDRFPCPPQHTVQLFTHKTSSAEQISCETWRVDYASNETSLRVAWFLRKNATTIRCEATIFIAVESRRMQWFKGTLVGAFRKREGCRPNYKTNDLVIRWKGCASGRLSFPDTTTSSNKIWFNIDKYSLIANSW